MNDVRYNLDLSSRYVLLTTGDGKYSKKSLNVEGLVISGGGSWFQHLVTVFQPFHDHECNLLVGEANQLQVHR